MDLAVAVACLSLSFFLKKAADVTALPVAAAAVVEVTALADELAEIPWKN